MKKKKAKFQEINTWSLEKQAHKAIVNGTFPFYSHYLEGHGLHGGMVLSKFELTQDYIVDFAYLTKSSISWHFVLCEIEKPNENMFRFKGANCLEINGFRSAMSQVNSWKAYLEDSAHRQTLKSKIKDLLVPSHMSKNPIEFRYQIMAGRRSEFSNSERKINYLHTLNEGRKDLYAFTYDSAISFSEQQGFKKFNFFKYKDGKFCDIKINSLDTLACSLVWLKPSALSLSKAVLKKLKNLGHDIGAWESNAPLMISGDKITHNKFI